MIIAQFCMERDRYWPNSNEFKGLLLRWTLLDRKHPGLSTGYRKDEPSLSLRTHAIFCYGRGRYDKEKRFARVEPSLWQRCFYSNSEPYFRLTSAPYLHWCDHLCNLYARSTRVKASLSYRIYWWPFSKYSVGSLHHLDVALRLPYVSWLRTGPQQLL